MTIQSTQFPPTTTRREQFSTIYREELRKAAIADPEAYAFAADQADVIADKMLAAFDRYSANKDGRAVKATCRRLGIKHTYQAIYDCLSS